MPLFAIDRFRMHYEIHEGLVPRDTLLLHGNLASNAWWEPAIAEWKRQSDGRLPGRLICAEWRGCGGSRMIESADELTLARLGADHNLLLAHLGAQNACLVGHSTGGLIGLAAMLAAPGLYARALLLDPVGATGVQFGPEMHEAFAQMSRDREFCAAVILGTVHGGAPAPDLREKIVNGAFGVHPFVWRGIPQMLQGVDLRRDLGALRQPVLVLHGEHDAVLPIADSRALAELLPNGRFEMLPGRGHCANVEDPALFVRLTNSFLYG